MPLQDSGYSQRDEGGINEGVLLACAEAILRWHKVIGVGEAERKMPASDRER